MSSLFVLSSAVALRLINEARSTPMLGRMWRGLPLTEAFQRWSDPAEFRELEEMDQRASSDDPAIALAAMRKAAELRRTLEQKFLTKLIRRDLQASAFELPISASSIRKTIISDVWELLDDVDYSRSEARGHGLSFIKVEVYTPPPPLIPPIRLFAQRSVEEAEPDTPEFEHNDDYSKVRIGEHTFEFEGIQCEVIRLLHEASIAGTPWLNGKRLLEKAGSKMRTLGPLFQRHKDPSWRELIESNGHGDYRLRTSAIGEVEEMAS